MNRQVILSSRPAGIPTADNFEIVTREDPEVADGQMLIRNRYLSVEPAMRGWIADVGNYSEPVSIGAVMRAICVGEVVQSRTDEYRAGEILTGWFGWQEQAVVEPGAVIRRVAETDLPISLALGILGINGITAHLALTIIGQPLPGQTVVVSTAAGAVGSAVGQIAKMMGCRTIGIAGGPDKVRLCREVFGFDDAVDYKNGPVREALADTCSDGLDVYFDNTAGAISDAVYPLLAERARVVVCGTASIPKWEPWPTGPRVERHLLVKRARAEGFVVFDHHAKFASSVAQLAAWVRDGRLRYLEDVLHGIEHCPDAINGLYRGENNGKRVIAI